MPMPRRRESRIRISYEMMHSMICLPDDIYIENIVVEPYRKLVSFIVSSDGEPTIGGVRTFDRGEGQEIIMDTLDFNSLMIERMRRTVQDWDNRQQEDQDRQDSREAMNTLYEQLTREPEER